MYDITTRIDLCKLVPLNGEGKNSTVYTFFDNQLGNEFIVKRIEKQLIYDDYGDNSDSNLFNESCILYKVKHPNIMEIQYASQDDDYVYMVMPKCSKGSLEAIINSEVLTVRKIVKFSLEFLLGLHYVHANKLIHFDIKPTNILINDNNKAILTDFGLSKFINYYGLSRPNKFYTPHYPPEAITATLLSNKSDIYQAGITMYRMCNGNEIFNNQLTSINSSDLGNYILAGKFPDRNYYRPHIPNKLRKIINKCIDINPDKRYETILDVINDLSNIDVNLDLVYEEINSLKVRIKKKNDKMTHYDCIDIISNGNTYNTKGYKVKIDDQSSTKINAWNFDNLTRTNVSKTVEKIFN